MEEKGFQNLVVWQKAHKLVLEIYRVTKDFPKEERYSLTSQLQRSSSSICANLAEGYKKSKKDFSRYIAIAQGSLEETKYHIILSNDLGYLDKNKFFILFENSEEVGKMMFGLNKSIKSKLTS